LRRRTASTCATVYVTVGITVFPFVCVFTDDRSHWTETCPNLFNNQTYYIPNYLCPYE